MGRRRRDELQRSEAVTAGEVRWERGGERVAGGRRWESGEEGVAGGRSRRGRRSQAEKQKSSHGVPPVRLPAERQDGGGVEEGVAACGGSGAGAADAAAGLRCSAARGGLGWLRPSQLSRVVPATETGRVGPICWFRFGNKDVEGAGIYVSQDRDDLDDVEQYFNYMEMLAVEGTYDKMEALLNQDIHPLDILLMLPASEGDRPKIEELLRAGANVDGRMSLDQASDETREFILGFAAKNA